MGLSPDLAGLAERLGLAFRQPALLRQAFVHSSCLNEDPSAAPSNERLEFLGDAVLDLVVAQELCIRCPDIAEGELTKRRAYMVNHRSLARVALKLDLGRHLRMGRGEEARGGRQRESNLESVLEALAGAVFLDGGFEAARAFVLRALEPGLTRVVERGVPQDPKVELQELAQARGLGLPAYLVVDSEGPEHARTFTVEVSVDGRVLGGGVSSRTLDAEREAAEQALDALVGKRPNSG